MVKFEVGKIYAKKCSFRATHVSYYIRVTKRNDTTIWFEELLLDGRGFTSSRPYRRVKEWDGKEYIGDNGANETVYADDEVRESDWEMEVHERKMAQKREEDKLAKRIRSEADALREWLKENNVSLADAIKIHERMMGVNNDAIEMLKQEEQEV